jgi:alpha-methylacyl-CoA racemase
VTDARIRPARAPILAGAPTGPLAGLRVLDLSRMLPAGALTQLLGDLGADVIKIERPPLGEETRLYGAELGGTTAPHAFIDRNKRSVALDLSDPRGVQAVRALAATSDVVVESFRPGVADRLGVGYEQLREVRPDVVYCSVNGYGSEGPRAAEPGHDVNYLAYAGALHFGGTADHGPQLAGTQSADLLGGLTAGMGVLAAVVAVRSGQPGRRVEVALADAALWGVGIHLSSWLAGGGADGPESTVVTGAGPAYRIYRCRDDRHLAVGAIEERFWITLVRALDREDLASRQHDPSAIAELEALFVSAPRDDWLAKLSGLDTCVTPVQDFDEVRADPQYAARGMFAPVPGVPHAMQVSQPIRFSTPLPQATPASATVGGDTMDVLAELDLAPDVLQSAREWNRASRPVVGRP